MATKIYSVAFGSPPTPPENFIKIYSFSGGSLLTDKKDCLLSLVFRCIYCFFSYWHTESFAGFVSSGLIVC